MFIFIEYTIITCKIIREWPIQGHRMVEILKNEINIVPFKQMPALNLHSPHPTHLEENTNVIKILSSYPLGF